METHVNGISLHYEVHGQDGPWLVLAHSLGMNADIWWQQVAAFSAQYRVITYDARGHGRSTRAPAPYSFDQLGDDLYQLLDDLDVKQVAAVGLSLGGNTVQVLAAQHPDLVRALVLADTTAWYGADGPRNWEQRAQDVRAQGLPGIADFQVTRWFTDAFRAAQPEIVQRFVGYLTANDPACFIAAQRALGAGDLRDSTAHITCPTLVVVGEEDYATPLPMAEDLHQRIAGSELHVLDRARHLSPIEQPTAFNTLVLDFLEQAGY